MSLGTTVLRTSIGPFFIGHGTQKLFGAFGGHGLEGTGGFFESLGLRPGRRHALVAGVAETTGGTLLTLGALTPLATTALTATMVTAIRKVHMTKGPWVSEGGYEYNAVLIAALTALADSGPGRPSVDAGAFPRMHGAKWALLSLAGGIAGSYLATSPALNPGEAPVEPPASVADPASPGVEEPRFTRDAASPEPVADERRFTRDEVAQQPPHPPASIG